MNYRKPENKENFIARDTEYTRTGLIDEVDQERGIWRFEVFPVTPPPVNKPTRREIAGFYTKTAAFFALVTPTIFIILCLIFLR